MTSTTTALSSDEQTHLHILLNALPQQFAAVDCNTYRTFRPIIIAAIPLIARLPIIGAKVAPALQFLITMADSVCPGEGRQVESSTGAVAPQQVAALQQAAAAIMGSIVLCSFGSCAQNAPGVAPQQAAAPPQAAAYQGALPQGPMPVTLNPYCGYTVNPNCYPTLFGCLTITQAAAPPQAAAYQGALPQGLTVFTLCTPVCNTYTPVGC